MAVCIIHTLTFKYIETHKLMSMHEYLAYIQHIYQQAIIYQVVLNLYFTCCVVLLSWCLIEICFMASFQICGRISNLYLETRHTGGKWRRWENISIFFYCVPNLCFIPTVGIITVSILGPDIAEAGVEHIFTCRANCTMECSTSWWFSHGFPQGSISVLGTEIRWTPAGSGLVQEFECTAENTLAQRSVQATKRVMVPGKSHLKKWINKNNMVLVHEFHCVKVARPH